MRHKRLLLVSFYCVQDVAKTKKTKKKINKKTSSGQKPKQDEVLSSSWHGAVCAFRIARCGWVGAKQIFAEPNRHATAPHKHRKEGVRWWILKRGGKNKPTTRDNSQPAEEEIVGSLKREKGAMRFRTLELEWGGGWERGQKKKGNGNVVGKTE